MFGLSGFLPRLVAQHRWSAGGSLLAHRRHLQWSRRIGQWMTCSLIRARCRGRLVCRCMLSRNRSWPLFHGRREWMPANPALRIQFAIGGPTKFANVQGSSLHQPCHCFVRRISFEPGDRQAEDFALDSEYREGARCHSADRDTEKSRCQANRWGDLISREIVAIDPDRDRSVVVQ